MAALHARSAGGGLRIGRHDARDARRAAGRRRRNGGSRLRALGMPPPMTSLRVLLLVTLGVGVLPIQPADAQGDRKSTRLNSSHGYISYAVFCLKKKINNKD